jgi:hypothetical protein
MEMSGSFTSRPLYPRGKCSWHPSDRRLGGLQSLSGRCGEEKYLLPSAGNRNLAIQHLIIIIIIIIEMVLPLFSVEL